MHYTCKCCGSVFKSKIPGIPSVAQYCPKCIRKHNDVHEAAEFYRARNYLMIMKTAGKDIYDKKCKEFKDVAEYVFNNTTPVNDVLREADFIINGGRNYGDPEDCFGGIRDYWSVYLDHNYTRGSLKDFDVAMMMILMKIAREEAAYKKDNFIDIAGYAALAEKLVRRSIKK